MIQFHLLVEIFADILINTKRKKLEKHVGMWLREKLFPSLEGNFFSFLPHSGKIYR